MGNDIAKLFGVEREEKGLISILLIQSIFLGIFYGVFNITAHSLFLAKFDEILMARAYILSGLAGIALTYLYTLLQSRMKFHQFSLVNLGFVLLATVSLWFLIVAQNSNWVIFAIFILMGPLNLLALLSFYGTAGRLFTLRQGRRLFGLVDTGIVVGVIVSSFSIPALLSLNVSTSNILLISAVSILGALLVQYVIGKRYEQVRTRTETKEKSSGSMKIFREDSYIRSLGMFIAFSMVVAFFVQYSFMAVTRVQYPEEADLAAFLGIFEGSMMVFTLLIKTFIFSYLIKNHGLKITLAIGPVLIGIFVVIAVIVGTTMGYQPEAGGFLIFFLLLALGRLFSKAMKDSVETPAFKVLYQTIAEKVRYSVQSTIDGTINEIAALASGLILTGLGALSFVKLIHFSWVLSILLAIWVYTAIKVYTEYRNSVKKSIDADDEEEKDTADIDPLETVAGSAIDIKNNFFNYVRAEDIISTIGQYPEQIDHLVYYARNHKSIDLLPLLKSLSPKDFGTEQNEKLSKTISELEEDYKKIKPALENISTEIDKVKDRKSYAKSVYASGSQLLITDLLKLIRDKDTDIRKEALYIVGRQRVSDLLQDVCDCLTIKELSSDAYSILRSFGVDAFETLNTHYFRSAGNTRVRSLVIRLFAETSDVKACDFLFDRLWSVHRDLRLEALNGLIKCNYTPSEESKDKIIQEIQDIIGLLTWNTAAAASLKENKDDLLLNSLNEETDWWTNFLFGLLSLIYDSKSFEKIRYNLESGTVESVNLALEMIDIVVDDAVKPRLTALLDVVSEEDKLKSLFQFYPGEVPDYNDLVVDLINTDYNKIGVWTKACAIKSLYNIENIEDPDFIVALLFSPNKILREEALRYLQSKFKDVYEYCFYRVPEKYKGHLQDIVAGEISPEGEIYSKIEFLHEIWPELSRNDIIDLALMLELRAGFVEEAESEAYLLWHTNKPEQNPAVSWRDIGRCLNEEETGKYKNMELYALKIGSLADAVFDKPARSEQIYTYLEKTLN